MFAVNAIFYVYRAMTGGDAADVVLAGLFCVVVVLNLWQARRNYVEKRSDHASVAADHSTEH